MMIGKLYREETGWVIQYRMDFDLMATDGGTIPVHPDHGFWLKMWGENGMEMPFQIDENGFAILKSAKETTHYPQD
jgi:hypothetical protein